MSMTDVLTELGFISKATDDGSMTRGDGGVLNDQLTLSSRE